MIELNENQMDRWERIRSGGKVGFVLKTACLFSAVLLSFNSLVDLVFDGETRPSYFRIIFYLTVGIGEGFLLWWLREQCYQHTLLNNRSSRDSQYETHCGSQ